MLRAKRRFDNSLARVKRLDNLYSHLTSTLHFPEIEVSDILRSEIVYMVSALDKYIHDIVKQGMIDIFLGSRVPTPTYKNFTINMNQLDAIKNATSLPPPISILENIIIDNHKHLSFQDPDKITSALSLIWLENYKWQKIGAYLGKTESHLKVELKNIVIRRNQIVHEGDLDILTGQLQNIEKEDVEEIIDFIDKLVNAIHNLV